MIYDPSYGNLSANKSKAPFVSVIIPTYNDAEHLEKCLFALEAQNYDQSRYEIIVVNNGFTDSTEDLLRNHPVKRIYYDKVKGSYAARNKGIECALGEIYAFTDSDCIPVRNWIERGVDNLIHCHECGLVGGNVRLFFQSAGNPTTIELIDNITFFQQEYNITIAKFSVTANLFTYKKVFDDVGLFNDALKSGGDLEWGRRVFSAGYSIGYANDVLVDHPARNSFSQLRAKVVRITIGLHEIEHQANRSILSLCWQIVSKDLLPPTRRLYQLLTNDKVNGFRHKVEAVLVVLVLKYIGLWTKIRLVFSSSSKRGG